VIAAALNQPDVSARALSGRAFDGQRAGGAKRSNGPALLFHSQVARRRLPSHAGPANGSP